jgi:thiazole/oxazole-forming peptide maturase SagD family component
MRLSVQGHGNALSLETRLLAARLISPICGIDQAVDYMLHGTGEPRFVVAGAELTGVHHLLGEPKAGSYHIGGGGIFTEEAMIRSLGESLERYAQLIFAITHRNLTRFIPYSVARCSSNDNILLPDKLRFFSQAELSEPTFPFRPFQPDVPISWLAMTSLLDGSRMLVPAQFVLVGYRPRVTDGEPCMLRAVSTGTAAHTRRHLALRNALLELIQVDAAMGHWYSASVAHSIELDDRVDGIRQIVCRFFAASGPSVSFYWLPSAGLGGMTVACLLHSSGRIPAVALGLGADTALAPALYKSMLEAVGVWQLAKLNLTLQELPASDSTLGSRILDLDSNVAFYADPRNAVQVGRKFTRSTSIPASELPPDSELEAPQEISYLLDGFRRSGMDLLGMDITTSDVAELGFTVVRAWSPDLLGMCLPGVPPSAHVRWKAYGGFADSRWPHPYP